MQFLQQNGVTLLSARKIYVKKNIWLQSRAKDYHMPWWQMADELHVSISDWSCNSPAIESSFQKLLIWNDNSYTREYQPNVYIASKRNKTLPASVFSGPDWQNIAETYLLQKKKTHDIFLSILHMLQKKNTKQSFVVISWSGVMRVTC